MTGRPRAIGLDEVERIDLGDDSWSRMVVTEETAPETDSSLGFSRFTPGTTTDQVRHEVEELAYVLAGEGELRVPDGTVEFGPDDALYIPPETWHAVANTGDRDVVMVFTFPYPDYPPTDRD